MQMELHVVFLAPEPHFHVIAMTEGGWSVLLNILLRILLELLVLGGAITTLAWTVKNRFIMLILKDVLHSGSGAALYCPQCQQTFSLS